MNTPAPMNPYLKLGVAVKEFTDTALVPPPYEPLKSITELEALLKSLKQSKKEVQERRMAITSKLDQLKDRLMAPEKLWNERIEQYNDNLLDLKKAEAERLRAAQAEKQKRLDLIAKQQANIDAWIDAVKVIYDKAAKFWIQGGKEKYTTLQYLELVESKLSSIPMALVQNPYKDLELPEFPTVSEVMAMFKTELSNEVKITTIEQVKEEKQLDAVVAVAEVKSELEVMPEGKALKVALVAKEPESFEDITKILKAYLLHQGAANEHLRVRSYSKLTVTQMAAALAKVAEGGVSIDYSFEKIDKL
jgi:TusA-related sulfurtransferase